jgi:hypothetical protein
VRLPNGSKADLGTKLEDYLLNPLHPQGKHKAELFGSVLGVTLANAEVLRAALLEAASDSDAAVSRGDNGFGEVYVLRFPFATAKATATLLTAWIIRHGEDVPRLITCYIV